MTDDATPMHQRLARPGAAVSRRCFRVAAQALQDEDRCGDVDRGRSQNGMPWPTSTDPVAEAQRQRRSRRGARSSRWSARARRARGCVERAARQLRTASTSRRAAIIAIAEQARQQARHRVRVDVLLLEPVHRAASRSATATPSAIQPSAVMRSARGERPASSRGGLGVAAARSASSAHRVRASGCRPCRARPWPCRLSNSSQALAWIAGNTAFCAASPASGCEQRAAAGGVLLQRLALDDVVGPDASPPSSPRRRARPWE